MEARSDDDATREVLADLNDDAAFRAVIAERSFLAELGAGCSIPAGAYAVLDGDEVNIRGVMITPDGSKSVRAELVGSDALALGEQLARTLRDEMNGGAVLGWES